LLPFCPWIRADIFHALNQRTDARLARKVVTTFHDLFVMTAEYSSAEFRARFSRQARVAARNSDLIIAVSEFTAHQVSELLSVERGRIRVVPHGVDVPATPSESVRQPWILFIGVLQARKNVLRLIEAFEQCPKPWRLILAGATTGYQSAEILLRIANSPSRDRIDVAGHVTDIRLRELLASSSIFAFPSLDEGFGIPVLEAMAWEVPVLTSNTSALAEIGKDAALLVDPKSTDAIMRGLIQLVESPGLRARLAKAGKSRAEALSWRNTIRKTYAVYQELAG